MEEFINEVEKVTRGFAVEFEHMDIISANNGVNGAKFSSKEIAMKYMDFVNKYKDKKHWLTEERALKEMIKSGELDEFEIAIAQKRLENIRENPEKPETHEKRALRENLENMQKTISDGEGR